jgi:hypothetical protein
VSRPERSARLVVLVAPGRPKELTARIADDLGEARLLSEGEALGICCPCRQQFLTTGARAQQI